MYINCQVNLSQIEIEPVAIINNELQQLMLEMGDKEARRIHVTKGGSSPAPARAPRARTRQVRGRPHPRPPGRVTGSRVADEQVPTRPQHSAAMPSPLRIGAAHAGLDPRRVANGAPAHHGYVRRPAVDRCRAWELARPRNDRKSARSRVDAGPGV